jgi:hypothetical protein
VTKTWRFFTRKSTIRPTSRISLKPLHYVTLTTQRPHLLPANILGFSGRKKNITFFFRTKHRTRKNSSVSYRITRGLVLTRPSVDRKKAHLCTTNTFISILFLREESSRQRYLDSYLQDNFGDMQYSASNPVRTEFHFSALHHGDYDVLWGAELWFVVCGCVLVRK